MSLQLRRIGGISEEKHAADVDGKVAEVLKNNDCVEVGECSAKPAAPLLLSASSRKVKRFEANSASAAGSQPVNRGVRQRERAVANTLGDKFKAYIKKECNSLVWLYSGGCTDALQLIEAGRGALIKVEVGRQLDLWLENGDNLERWESNALTASERRVFLTKWVATAVETVENRAGYRFRVFEKTGSLMTTDETGDDRINLEGLMEPLALSLIHI